jgi:branched-chain amino acid transport system permease protein
MVLLGGVETVSGGAIGAALYRGLSILVRSQTDYSKLVLGAIVILVVVAFPRGLGGVVERLRTGWAGRGQ